jgi:hypothetical protein
MAQGPALNSALSSAGTERAWGPIRLLGTGKLRHCYCCSPSETTCQRSPFHAQPPVLVGCGWMGVLSRLLGCLLRSFFSGNRFGIFGFFGNFAQFLSFPLFCWTNDSGHKEKSPHARVCGDSHYPSTTLDHRTTDAIHRTEQIEDSADDTNTGNFVGSSLRRSRGGSTIFFTAT